MSKEYSVAISGYIIVKVTADDADHAEELALESDDAGELYSAEVDDVMLASEREMP